MAVLNLPLLAAGFSHGIFIITLIAVLLAFVLGVYFIATTAIGPGKGERSGRKGLARLWAHPVPETVKESPLSRAPYFKLDKGFDIRIQGAAVKEVVDYRPATYAVNPKDFIGISPIPKVEVEPGAEVKCGDVLFYDKKNPRIKYTAPVSGEVVAVNRGEKRSIEDIVILADQQVAYRDFGKQDLAGMSRDQVRESMLEAGLWPLLKQRPYNTLADIEENPRDIFISAFDSAPLAADLNFTMQGREQDFQAGIDALAKLTDGSVHLSLNAGDTPAPAFLNARNVKHFWFEGKHPAGNVGVQIHHINRIVKGDVVWTISAEDVAILGKFFREGIYDPVRVVALGGPELKAPKYYRTRAGAQVAEMLKDNLIQDHVRVISGNVLTGEQTDANQGHLRFFDNQLTVVEEGDKYELFGWLIPSYMRPSLSRTFPAALFPNYEHRVNTNTHGERRAFVETGQYEQVLPMDVYPVHLIKSILANDLDRMEGLGIYEVVEEDLALCEFVCTSKQPVQKILREGMEYLKEQV